MKPKDLGISPYFTLDETSKLESIYLQLHPEQNIGDSGSSTPSSKKKSHPVSQSLQHNNTHLGSVLAPIPEELNHRNNSFKSQRDVELELEFDDDEEAFAAQNE